MRTLIVFSLLGIAFFSTACLSSNHRIGKGELTKLSQMAPERRGDSVRVVQEIGGDSGPQADRVSGNTYVYIHAPIWVDGHPRRHRPRPGNVSGGGVARPNGHNGGSVHRPSRGSSNVAKKKADNAKALMALAAVAAIGLAATEGARYDGWVQLHPMHPVHLIGPYGGHSILPLAHIDERTAQWADHAYVRDSEGPWHTLGRAPLNRKGFTYSLFLGGGTIPVKGLPDSKRGFVGHIQFGYFLSHIIGLQLDLGMAWANDGKGNIVYNSRTSLEVQGHFVQAGPVHAGLFGQIGISNRWDDGVSKADSSILMGGGALLQLDLTTRLALTGRVGVVRAFGEPATEIGVGLSIY